MDEEPVQDTETIVQALWAESEQEIRNINPGTYARHDDDDVNACGHDDQHNTS